MQLNKSNYFEARSLYYPLDRYCQNYNIEQELVKDETGRINKYSSLKPVYALNVLGYNHFNSDNDALRIFEFYNVKQAAKIIDFVNLGEEERAMVLAYEKAQATYDASLVDAFINGKESRDKEIALLMLQENSSIEFIMRVTNLTREQIEELEKENRS